MKFFLRVLLGLGVILGGVLISVELDSGFLVSIFGAVGILIMEGGGKRKDKKANT